VEKFLHLHHVISKGFGRSVDGRQATADHGDGHADLKIRNRRGLCGSVELESHQEIRRLTYAARQTVLHRDHGWPARAGAQRDVVEAI